MNGQVKIFMALVLVLCTSALQAQSTFGRVYNIIQTSCTFSSCHASSKQAGGLDLEGTGSTVEEKQDAVYNNIVGKAPANTYAAAKGNQLIYPGDPYRSFIFRKAHGGIGGIEVELEKEEGDPMPQNGVPLEPVDAEIIRQWIVYGAPQSGEVVDVSLLQDYYNGNGLRPTQRPVPPAADSGFQIHLGPFFLAPSANGKRSEIEYFSRYEAPMKADKEIIRILPAIGKGYSHHFILYRYRDGEENKVKPGLRGTNGHSYTTIVSAHQDDTPLELPQYTAFAWKENTVLDLNTHYINYSGTKVLAADVYVNIYTQPKGLAKQTMFTDIIPNTQIYIPNDSQKHTFTHHAFHPVINQRIYVWAIGSHTHQWGRDYDVYMRDANGTAGEQVYDGSCKEGIPGCFSQNYDYQHPPVRFFDRFLPVMTGEGFVQKATYINTGSKPVFFGETSEDEMMVLALMYTFDTTGLFPWVAPVDTSDVGIGYGSGSVEAEILPNPFTDVATVRLNVPLKPDHRITLFDARGRLVMVARPAATQRDERSFLLYRDDLQKGLYFYKLEDGTGNIASGKVVVR